MTLWKTTVCVPNDCRKSNGCYCKIARLWRTSSRRHFRLHSDKTERRSEIAQNSEVRMSRRVETSSTTQMAQTMGKHSRPCGTSWTKFTWTPIGRIVKWQTIRGSSIETWMGKRTKLGMSFCSSQTRIRHKNCWKEAEYGSHVEEDDENMWILTNQLHFLITYSWDVLNVNANRTRILLMNTERCLNHVFLLEQLKNYQVEKSFTQKPSHGPTTWKDMLENASSDIANWQTKKWSNYTKFQVSRRMFNKFALKLSWNVCTWHELGDQTFYGQ